VQKGCQKGGGGIEKVVKNAHFKSKEGRMRGGGGEPKVRKNWPKDRESRSHHVRATQGGVMEKKGTVGEKNGGPQGKKRRSVMLSGCRTGSEEKIQIKGTRRQELGKKAPGGTTPVVPQWKLCRLKRVTKGQGGNI